MILAFAMLVDFQMLIDEGWGQRDKTVFSGQNQPRSRAGELSARPLSSRTPRHWSLISPMATREEVLSENKKHYICGSFILEYLLYLIRCVCEPEIRDYSMWRQVDEWWCPDRVQLTMKFNLAARESDPRVKLFFSSFRRETSANVSRRRFRVCM